jgi:hypothetical protein
MKKIVTLLMVFFINLISVQELSAQTPPTKVTQADGTIQLVPVPPATVYTPYFIDPSMTYRVVLESQWSNKDWNGATKNGLLAKKGDIVEARILAQPITKTKVVDGKTVYLWSIFRSGDFIVTWDAAKFELIAPTVVDLVMILQL